MLPPAEVLDLVAGVVELALEVAVPVAQRLEIVVELAERQAQLPERELDVLATVAAAEALVAQGWPLIYCQERSLAVRSCRHRHVGRSFRSPS